MSSPRRILIISQDIVGPINNGGIGTAYYYAATELARMGHQVSVLYTLNRYTEKKDIDYWIRDYREKNVTLIACSDPDVPVFPGIHGLVASIPYNAYEWLKKHENQFDIVHGSEWCANLFYCLLSKKLGLHFSNIQFVVKTSSPHIWNRIGNNDPISQYTDLPRIFMERMSVEWADVVIGGSHYLLNWMEQNGYDLPEGRCFVQPNIFPVINADDSKQGASGSATELVFFGRLERRKGLHLFLDALQRLIQSQSRGEVDLSGVSITFLGKSRRVYNAKKAIAAVLDDSVLPYRIIGDMGQPEALQFLKEGDGKLAIMPSVMDNSPFGVYELLGYRVPFITSTAGGGKELIHEDDRERVLFEVHPHAIHQALLRLVNKPLFTPRPSFDMQHSLDVWDQWHRRLPSAHAEKAGTAANQPLVSICLAHFNRPQELSEAIASIKALDYDNFELIIVDDGSTSTAALDYLESIQQQDHGFPVQVYSQPNLYLGASRNLAASHAQGEYLLFMDDDNLAKKEELKTLVTAIEHTAADILTSFGDTFWSKDVGNLAMAARKRIVYFGADLTSGMYRNPYGDSNCLVRRSSFEKLGGFTEDYKIGRDDQEFFSRAILNGMKLFVLPEAVYWYRLSRTRMRQSQFSQFAGLQRVSNPYIEVPGLPVEYANILRYSQGMAAIRLGVVANTMSQLSQNSRLRKLVQRFPVVYRALGKLHRMIT